MLARVAVSSRRVFGQVKAIKTFATAPAATGAAPKIVEPQCYSTLEWCVESPPSAHSFEEPPIVVEIEHLDNLVHTEEY